MNTLHLLGGIVLISGALFLFFGALGVLRMPDCYTRIQAGTKASTLGAILSLSGIAILHPPWTGKCLLVIFFVLLTNPVSSHVLARAAHRSGILPMKDSVVDELGAESVGRKDHGNEGGDQ